MPNQISIVESFYFSVIGDAMQKIMARNYAEVIAAIRGSRIEHKNLAGKSETRSGGMTGAIQPSLDVLKKIALTPLIN